MYVQVHIVRIVQVRLRARTASWKGWVIMIIVIVVIIVTESIEKRENLSVYSTKKPCARFVFRFRFCYCISFSCMFEIALHLRTCGGGMAYIMSSHSMYEREKEDRWVFCRKYCPGEEMIL